MHPGVLAVAIASLSQVSPPPPAPRTETSAQPAVIDALELVGPADIHLRGWLGARVAANARWLSEVDLEPMLAGFRHKPGSHPWIGEHIGKWMHAATLAWVNTSEPELKAKLRERLDYAAAELIKAQEPDGYLGTYVPEQRFGLFPGADWDVWSHKYCLIGLLCYYEHTGSAAALTASKKAGDLLIRTFAPPPEGAGKSINAAGTHMGMAATSVLEPIVRLYRLSGDARYLLFAGHIVRAYDETGGPKIVASLLSHGSVHKTANGKTYEMLSNLVGLCEFYRVSGSRNCLDAARNGWEDTVRNQLYITGTASHHEHFHVPHELPNEMSANVGETCVTVTWIQLCSQLLRLTGEAKYGDEIERSMYNHLAAAQHPDGRSWCYYTSLEGTKPYTSDTCCCLSSGPRGLAMAPEHVFLRGRHGISEAVVVNLFESASAMCTLGGKQVTVSLETEFPAKGRSVLRIEPVAGTVSCAVLLRAPEWAHPVLVGGEPVGRDPRGWMAIGEREWSKGEQLEIEFLLYQRWLPGLFANSGKHAVAWGPLILAYDESTRAGSPPGAAIRLEHPVYRAETESALVFTWRTRLGASGDSYGVQLVPFADAGATGGRYRVWFARPGALDAQRLSRFLGGTESRSVEGNISGSINDADDSTLVVTFDGKPQHEAWFAVTGRKPVEFHRVVFVHGRTFHDGGWFDSSAGPPRVEVQDEADGAWRQVASLDDYPRTSATDAAGLTGGERFEVKFETPVRAAAVRVIGIPACGDNAAQNFASCAELGVFAE